MLFIKSFLTLISIIGAVFLESRAGEMQEVDQIFNKHQLKVGSFRHLMTALSTEEAKFVEQHQGSDDENEIMTIASLYAQQAYSSTKGQHPKEELFLEAIRWYKKAASKGCVEAIALLGNMLEKVLHETKLKEKFGGETNLRSAIIELFELAARNGDEDAEIAYQDRLDRYSKL